MADNTVDINNMGKTAFIYPGQGAQFVGMGKDAAALYPSAAKVFQDASEALGFDIGEMVFDGDEETLKITENTQPALLTTCTALTAVLLERGLRADVTAGLSIGEYASHVLSGTFGFTDAVAAVRLRGRYMQEEVPVGVGAMAAILGLDSETVEDCCKLAPDAAGDALLVVEPANYNCPGQIVVAGHARAVEAACELCKQKGAKRAVQLAVSAPFHCLLLKGAGEKLKEVLSGISFSAPKIPVVSNVTARYVEDADTARELLVRQVASPVRWEQCVRTMIADGVTRFVEIGPGKTIAGFIKKIDKTAEVINVSDADSLGRV